MTFVVCSIHSHSREMSWGLVDTEEEANEKYIKKRSELEIIERGEFRVQYSSARLWQSTKKFKPLVLRARNYVEILSLDHWKDVSGADISPIYLLSSPENSPKHMKAIEDSNVSYPILLYNVPNTNKSEILDGLHRLTKAYRNGMINENSAGAYVNVIYVPDRLLQKAKI